MEAQPQSGSRSDAYPRWVMLEQYLENIKVQQDSSSSPTDGDDPKTLAAARTSAGHPIQVSLRLAEPPALSRAFLRIPDGITVIEKKSKVLAAHGDSVLIQVFIEEKNQRHHTVEHLVYNAGAHAAEPARPPSLWLLPPYYELAYFSGEDLVTRELSDHATGLLRRGEDDLDLVVAELWVCSRSSDGDDTPRTGVLYLFRSGEWKRYEFEIREDWEWDLPRYWVSWDTVVPVDDRRLCWVDLSYGVMLFVDVSEETLTVEYVRLPMDPRDCKGLNRNVCTTAGGGALKFVNIFGRCCCGAAASCNCEHSCHAYTIHTWTMRIDDSDDGMEWVKDGMVDATELWALDAYKDLPCDPLDRPIVSIDEPEVICFRMRNTKGGSRTLWQIMVNMRSKTIHSVSRHEEDLGHCYARENLIPSKVSYFFNTLTAGQIQVDDHERPPPAVAFDEQLILGDDDSSNPTLQPSSVAELASVQALLEMFDALQEIPSYGLAGPQEVKAYRILSSDNGRRLTSLLRLPKDMRKDWLLMEIKATDAY